MIVCNNPNRPFMHNLRYIILYTYISKTDDPLNFFESLEKVVGVYLPEVSKLTIDATVSVAYSF